MCAFSAPTIQRGFICFCLKIAIFSKKIIISALFICTHSRVLGFDFLEELFLFIRQRSLGTSRFSIPGTKVLLLGSYLGTFVPFSIKISVYFPINFYFIRNPMQNYCFFSKYANKKFRNFFSKHYERWFLGVL